MDLLHPECDGSKGTPVLTERLVTEGNWYKFRSGHLRIDIHDANYNS
jgi:hypothetical protein